MTVCNSSVCLFLSLLSAWLGLKCCFRCFTWIPYKGVSFWQVRNLQEIFSILTSSFASCKMRQNIRCGWEHHLGENIFLSKLPNLSGPSAFHNSMIIFGVYKHCWKNVQLSQLNVNKRRYLLKLHVFLPHSLCWNIMRFKISLHTHYIYKSIFFLQPQVGVNVHREILNIDCSYT